jgi:hypothetical protein
MQGTQYLCDLLFFAIYNADGYLKIEKISWVVVMRLIPSVLSPAHPILPVW